MSATPPTEAERAAWEDSVYCWACGWTMAGDGGLLDKRQVSHLEKGCEGPVIRKIRHSECHVSDLVAENKALRVLLEQLDSLVQGQADDEALWLPTKDAPTAYIQQELRILHAAVERQWKKVTPASRPESEQPRQTLDEYEAERSARPKPPNYVPERGETYSVVPDGWPQPAQPEADSAEGE